MTFAPSSKNTKVETTVVYLHLINLVLKLQLKGSSQTFLMKFWYSHNHSPRAVIMKISTVIISPENTYRADYDSTGFHNQP